MGRLPRICLTVVTGLLLTGCLSSEPKVAEVAQVTAEQRAAMTATEGGGEGDGGEAGGTFTFIAIDIAYEEAPDTVPSGGVQMELVNEGQIVHNVVIEETGEKVLDADAGESDTAEVALEPGEYVYFCDIAGHREAGMEGTLTVSG